MGLGVGLLFGRRAATSALNSRHRSRFWQSSLTGVLSRAGGADARERRPKEAFMNGRQFIYHMQGLTKTYPGQPQGAREHPSVVLSGRQDRRARRQRLRQVDAAAHHGRHRQGVHRRGLGRRRRPRRLSGAGAAARPDKSVRENVMEGVAAKKALLDRYNEIAANYSDETADEMAKLQDEIDSQESVGSRFAGRSGDGRAALPAGRRRRRQSFPAASAAASRCAGCCSTSRNCCCSTSRPTISTPNR